MSLFDRIADLPLVVEETELTRRERDTSSGFRRATTTFGLSGEGETGRGEDVAYDTEDHDALREAGASAFDLAGEYSFAEFSERLDGLDLFPTEPPTHEAAGRYRRWALESAGLDLALRQADRTLGEAFDREYRPVRFVASTRLGDPPTIDRVRRLLDDNPELEFKLDTTSAWDDELVAELAATDAVRVLDLKGHYRGTTVDQAADPPLYELVLDGFPEAVVEDPALTEETEHLFDGEEGRVSWDAPITGVESAEALPFEPRWLNVKPSRFGSVESLLETLEWCEARDVRLYGGGQFELGVGRDHVQALASLFYPDGPNDVAPGVYNDPAPPAELPRSPLAPSPGPGVTFRADGD